MHRTFTKLKNLSLIISLLLFIGVPVISNSADKVKGVEGLKKDVNNSSIQVSNGLPDLLNSDNEVKTVEGLIESVTVNYVEVHGEYYNILGVPLKDASGQDLSKDQLKEGRKVEIFLRGKSVTTILIYDENMLE